MIETYEVERVVAAHDVGRAVNPLLCEGQIEGAVHMGLGCALAEISDRFVRPTSQHHSSSLDIIRPRGHAPVDVIIVESPEPELYGIRRWQKLGLYPAGAVAAAIRSTGQEWPTELPIQNTANRERAGHWR